MDWAFEHESHDRINEQFFGFVLCRQPTRIEEAKFCHSFDTQDVLSFVGSHLNEIDEALLAHRKVQVGRSSAYWYAAVRERNPTATLSIRGALLVCARQAVHGPVTADVCCRRNEVQSQCVAGYATVTTINSTGCRTVAPGLQANWCLQVDRDTDLGSSECLRERGKCASLHRCILPLAARNTSGHRAR